MEQNEEQVEALEEEFINYNEDADTTCTICQAEFLDPDDLTIHLHQIHKISDHIAKTCDFCTTKYKDLMSYAEHLRDNHVTSLLYCHQCLRAFLDYDEHRAHEKKHKSSSNSLHNCAHCHQRFGNLNDLKKHDFETHHDSKEGVLMQTYLPYLSAVMKIKAETVMLSLNTKTVYCCVGCSFSTADINIFFAHTKSKNCTSYVCDKCSNVYKTKSNIKRHMLRFCDKSCGKSKVCPDCNLIFNNYSISKHKRNCKAIKCIPCGTSYNTMYELSEHQSQEHPLAVELKTCNFCWKQCVGTVALQKHIDRSHKPNLHLYKYICVHCKTPFTHPQKLFGHYFSKHKDLEPYTCKICDSKFRLRKKFTLHIKLTHKSVGFVEFDENYNVFFTEKKPENPFIPKSIYADEIEEQKKIDAASDKSEDTSDNLLNINSEMSVTETEGNQTEVESAPKPTLKRKRQTKNKKEEVIPIESSDDDDQPLLVVKKKVQKTMPKVSRNRWTKKKISNVNIKKFTCNICKKYCYTYQNYNNHMSLHSKRDFKKCIKCSKVFRSKEKLNNHVATEHSTSRLTETLKYMIEKRKKGESIFDDLPMSERFRRTIKKVHCDEVLSTATITPVENGLSVQKFIENFTPEVETKVETDIGHAIAIKVASGPPKEPSIKMTKFQVKPTPSITKLSMPVKFKAGNYEKTLASIRVVQPVPVFNEDNEEDSFQNYDDHDNGYVDRDDSIPEVAEEVMLEGTEETPKAEQIPHKIVIPNLPVEYKDIRIAHMLPQAPYYKIVKVNEVLNMQNIEQNEPNKVRKSSDMIKLPDGTKLVNTNPLAHLLGKTPLEKVLEPMKNKYYKPKSRNFQGMLAEALSNLDKPTPRKRKKEIVSAKPNTPSSIEEKTNPE